MVGGWKHFWHGLFTSEALKPKHILLIALAALCFTGMVLGVSAWAAIPAVVIFYSLDPILKFLRSRMDRRNKSNQRTIVETNFRRHLQRKKRELPSDQPELPLSLPHADRSEPSP